MLVWDQEIMKPIKIPSPIIEKGKAEIIDAEELKDLDYKIFSKSHETLKNSLLTIFESRNIRNPNLRNLIEVICINYQENPFHSFFHGFAVCQLLYVISERNTKFHSFLPEAEEFLLLLSGLGHDLNHPGVNNAFLINAKHELAAKYNNSAVLENYHAATLLELLNQSNFDINIPSSEKEKILLIILATDMGSHKQVLTDFAEITKNYDINNNNHRMAFMRMMLHGADISNPALNFELATVWSLKIIQEFNSQVWKEEQLGLPISEFMRIGYDIEKIKRSQIVFIDLFIHPLWKSISEFVPNTSELVENIEKNRKHWEELEKL